MNTNLQLSWISHYSAAMLVCLFNALAGIRLWTHAQRWECFFIVCNISLFSAYSTRTQLSRALTTFANYIKTLPFKQVSKFEMSQRKHLEWWQHPGLFSNEPFQKRPVMTFCIPIFISTTKASFIFSGTSDNSKSLRFKSPILSSISFLCTFEGVWDSCFAWISFRNFISDCRITTIRSAYFT